LDVAAFASSGARRPEDPATDANGQSDNGLEDGFCLGCLQLVASIILEPPCPDPDDHRRDGCRTCRRGVHDGLLTVPATCTYLAALAMTVCAAAPEWPNSPKPNGTCWHRGQQVERACRLRDHITELFRRSVKAGEAL